MAANGLHVWLRKNILTIVLFLLSALTGSIIGFTALQGRVGANEIHIENLEKIVAEYPSEKWFELKFNTIDDRFESLEEKLE